MNDPDPERPIFTVVRVCPGMHVLQDQTGDKSELTSCPFSTLPVELQMYIFSLAIDSNDSELIALTAVCRLWRSMILNMQTLWRRFIISNETKREKVDTWLQRAGGTFSSLLFKEGFDFDTLPGLFGSASANIWSSLDHLEIRSIVPRTVLLPPTAYKELRLRSLILTIIRPSPNFWDDLWIMDVSRMRDLQINLQINTSFRPSSDPIPIAGSRFTGLVTLRLRGVVDESALLDVLERNPMLETLALATIIPREPGLSRRIELINLIYLEYCSTVIVDDFLQCLESPNLTTLRLLGVVEESAFLSVLEHNLMLKQLAFSTVKHREHGSSRRVELINLTRLECRSSECVDDYLCRLSFPNLKTLCLINSTLRSSEALLANTFVHLEELSLAMCDIPSSALITLLRKACALTHLEIMYPKALDRSALNCVFEALESSIPGGLEGTPRTLCCPRLQRVILFDVPEFTAEVAMGLVKARLPNIGSAIALDDTTVRPLPIVYLELDSCPPVDRDSLHWFEAHVPKFVHRPHPMSPSSSAT